MRFCRLIFFFLQKLKIVQIVRFLGRFGPKCTFSTFDLENDGQSHTYSRSKYQKRVVSEKTEDFELSHVQIGRLVWTVDRSKKKKKKYVSPVSMLNHTSSLLYSDTAEYIPLPRNIDVSDLYYDTYILYSL
jgi:hypothetical protein